MKNKKWIIKCEHKHSFIKFCYAQDGCKRWIDERREPRALRIVDKTELLYRVSYIKRVINENYKVIIVECYED